MGVSFSQTTFTVSPGQSQTLTASFTLPKVEASTYPVFSGFIQVFSGTEKLHVSYIGLAASLKDKHVLDTTDQFFGVPLPAILDSTGDIQASPVNYTFVGDDFPTLLFRCAPIYSLVKFDPYIYVAHIGWSLGLLPFV